MRSRRNRPQAPVTPPAAASQSDEDAFGGEIRAGGGAAPGFMRWLTYATYVAGAAYLLWFWPDAGYAPTVVIVAGLILAWVIYIYFGNKPAEP